jgi:hypothetical protein
VTLLFVWLTMIYVSLVGNLTDLGENYRFRFAVEPLAALVLAATLQAAWSRRTRKPRSTPPQRTA